MCRALRICAPNYRSRVTVFSVLSHPTTHPIQPTSHHTTLALRLSITYLTLLLPPIVLLRSPPLFLSSLYMLFTVTTLPLSWRFTIPPLLDDIPWPCHHNHHHLPSQTNPLNLSRIQIVTLTRHRPQSHHQWAHIPWPSRIYLLYINVKAILS